MTHKNSNKRFFLGIAVAVLLPLSFYITARLLKKDHINMPRYYVTEKINRHTENGRTVSDTMFHRIPNLEFTNQLGEPVSLNEDLRGKILVINFIFTHCPTVCPQLTQNMKLLQRAFRKDPKRETDMNNQVQLLTFTVDPERDSFQQLRLYADRFGVNHDHWYFLTGPKQKIYDFARNDLGLSLQDGAGTDFIHTEKIVVVDTSRYIRGYYDGLDSVALGQCAYDISLLSMEKHRKK